MSKRNRGPKALEYEIGSEGLDDNEETEAPSTESTDFSDPIPGFVVNAKQVYVRMFPEKVEGNEIAILKEGDEFEILNLNGDYCKVRLSDGRVGFIAYEFCREV